MKNKYFYMMILNIKFKFKFTMYYYYYFFFLSKSFFKIIVFFDIERIKKFENFRISKLNVLLLVYIDDLKKKIFTLNEYILFLLMLIF